MKRERHRGNRADKKGGNWCLISKLWHLRRVIRDFNSTCVSNGLTREVEFDFYVVVKQCRTENVYMGHQFNIFI